MKSIFVTGASGQIGSALVPLLAKKYKVYCLVRSKLKYKHKNIVEIKGDIQSRSSVKMIPKNVFAIIHLAAYKYNTKTLEEMRMINTQGTKNLFSSNKAHFIYISTWLAKHPEKTGFYGITKLEAENLVKKRKHNYTILRLPHIYNLSVKSKFITKYILPLYLLLRYRLVREIAPLNVKDTANAISYIIGKREYFNKSLYVTGAKSFKPTA